MQPRIEGAFQVPAILYLTPVLQGTRRRLVQLALVLLPGLASTVAAAAETAAGGPDLHRYWDDRCQGCHGDSADFARRTLSVAGGRLQGRHHVDELPRFLGQHYLAAPLVQPVLAMLQAQVQAMPLYRQHCRRCHDSAAQLARDALALREGRLVVRTRGEPVDALLARHGGLDRVQALELEATLARVAREVGLR
jgi:mono/diheme cytochrome c family protein